jgi:GntR family transcriptional regulator
MNKPISDRASSGWSIPAVSRKQARGSLTDSCVEALTEAIGSRVYAPGDPLPSETDLATQLDVSRATLREALRTLEDRQLIIRRHGRGTFVNEVPIVKDLHRNFGITAMIRAAGYHPATANQVLETTPATREIAEKLCVQPESPVTRLRRLRLADKRPVVLSTEFLPGHICTDKDLNLLSDNHQSLYTFLYRHKGIAIYRGRAELIPMKATVELAVALEVKRGSLLLCISQVDFDDRGRAVMYSIEHHVADWVHFVIERIGPGAAVDD